MKDLPKVPAWRLEWDLNLWMQGTQLNTELPQPTWMFVEFVHHDVFIACIWPV